MNRFTKGLSYAFNRNLGKTDRIIRFAVAIMVIVSWYFSFIVGALGTIIFILAIMLLGTAATAKCSIVYLLEANTMTEEEKLELDEKGINYE